MIAHLNFVVVFFGEASHRKTVPVSRIRLLAPPHSVDTPWRLVRVDLFPPAASFLVSHAQVAFVSARNLDLSISREQRASVQRRLLRSLLARAEHGVERERIELSTAPGPFVYPTRVARSQQARRPALATKSLPQLRLVACWVKYGPPRAWNPPSSPCLLRSGWLRD